MIHIRLPFGHVFGTAEITVLVTSDFSQLEESSSVFADEEFFHPMLNLISSHPSHGIIRIFCSQSHCLVYVNV
jgi:hypothetical protein